MAQAARISQGARSVLGGQHSEVYYLWLLLALELIATAWLRNWSRNHHGG